MQSSDEGQSIPIDADRRRKLVEAAIRAPSGDNCQPWRFRFQRDSIEIDLVPERAESFFDFRNRGSFISVGAVIENVRTQARALGLAACATYPGGVGAGSPAARMHLGAGDGAPPPSAERVSAMYNRSVNRRPFLPVRISAKMQRTWTVDPVAGTEVTVIEDRRTIWRWSRLVYLGDRIRWTHPALHRELFETILFSNAEAQSKRRGLEIDRLGAGPAAALIMRFIRPWSRMQRLCGLGFDRALAMQTRVLAHCAGALVLVTIHHDDPVDWMKAGEQVQRLWVIAHEQGLCVQPLPVAMYLDQRYRDEGAGHFMPQHIPLLESMRAEFASILQGRIGAMLYRVGFGPRMSHPAVRLPVEEFFRDLRESGQVTH